LRLNVVKELEYNPVKITHFSSNVYCGVWSFDIAMKRRLQEEEPEAIMKVTSLFATVCVNEMW